MSKGNLQRDLPSSWRLVKLREICKQDRQIIVPQSSEAISLTYYSMEHIESESGRIQKNTIDNIEDEGKSTSFRFDERHVLYGKLRPYLNKVAVPDAPGRCTTEMIPLLPSDDIDREFLAWILRSNETVEFAMRSKTGSRMPRADMDDLLALEIPLPPLPEQQRIAALLNEQMAAVNKARLAAQARLEAVKALPAAYLRQVFPQPGEPLPNGWRWIKLKDVIRESQAGFACGERDVQGIVQLRMNNLDTRGNFLWDTVLRVPNIVYMIEQFYLSPGDVLFNNTNSTELVGKSALFKDYPERIVYSNHFTRLRTNPQLLLPDFLARWLNYQWQQRVFAAICNRWIGQSAVKADKLLNLDVPLPPLPEQQCIAALLKEQLAAVEQARLAVEAELAAINVLPAALLRRAFNGEL